MEIYVNYLAIEVTRRCNMKCNHCLRGDAQKLPSFSRAASRL